jgi:hypothetical protein
MSEPVTKKLKPMFPCHLVFASNKKPTEKVYDDAVLNRMAAALAQMGTIAFKPDIKN